MIDTHTHIFDEAFDADRDQVVTRATAVGVQKMVLPAIDSQSHDRVIDTVKKFPNICYGAMGLHPTSVNDNPNWREELAIVEKYLAEKPLEWVAIGEVGLDLYWSRDYLQEQTEAFRRQIELAARYDLPLIIHTRDAWDEMMEVIAPYATTTRGVFHSFSGEERHIEKILNMDTYYIGVGGVVTYKKSNLPEMLTDIPLERIVLETDSPYLPPVPHRGKRNESSYLELIAARLADIKGTTIEDVKKITTNSAIKLFFS